MGWLTWASPGREESNVDKKRILERSTTKRGKEKKIGSYFLGPKKGERQVGVPPGRNSKKYTLEERKN